MIHKISSRLDSSITYSFNKKEGILYDEDKEMEVEPYSIKIKNNNILIAVGSQRSTYISKNILYVPIYLIHENSVVSRIGVFEFLESELFNIVVDNEIQLEHLGDPVLFPFVNSSYLSNYEYVDSDEEDTDEEDTDEEDTDEEDTDEEDTDEEDTDEEDTEEEDTDEEDTEEEDTDEEDTDEEDTDEEDTDEEDTDEEDTEEEDTEEEETEEEDTEEDDTEEREKDHRDDIKYNMKKNIDNRNERRIKFSGGKNWIQNYFHDGNYKIIENIGGGDCLFDAIKQAYKSVGKDTSVQKLRNLIANEIDEPTFNQYYNLYLTIKVRKDDIKKDMKELNNKYNSLKRKFKQSDSKSETDVFMSELRRIAEEYKRMEKELTSQESFLNEFKFMKDVKDIDDFKEVVQTCKFWADSWAISTLERVLNIKLIILSKEAYENENLTGVIQCGGMEDNIIREKGVFNPDKYIIMEWIGYHYRVVSYKGNYVFQYKELPFDVKEIIFKKCMKSEQEEGLYMLIPEFKRDISIYNSI